MRAKVPLLAIAATIAIVGCGREGDREDTTAEIDAQLASPQDQLAIGASPAGVGDCAGTYEGTFAGGDSGDFQAVIDGNGGTKVVFLSSGAGFSIEGFGAVDANSRLTASSSAGSQSEGTLDRDECTAIGEWQNDALGISGTWEMARVSPLLTTQREVGGCVPGSGTDLAGEVLIRPDFSGQDLRCADLSLAEFAQPDFTDAALDGAVLRGADLEEPVFSGTTMVGADLRGIVLTRARFVNVDLRNADLQAVVVDDITFINTVCPDGTNSDESATSTCVIVASG